MLRVIGCIFLQHDIRLVALAGGLCLFACATALNMLTRAQASRGGTRAVWVVMAGAVTAAGIWGTHFVAMLAYQPGLPIGYDPWLTVLSIFVAALVSSA